MNPDCQRCREPARWAVNGGIACDDCRVDYIGRVDKTLDFSTWAGLYPTPLKKGDPTCYRCKTRAAIVPGASDGMVCLPCAIEELRAAAAKDQSSREKLHEAIERATVTNEAVRAIRALRATPVDTRKIPVDPRTIAHDTPKCTCGADSVPHEGHSKYCDTRKKRD